LYTCAGCTKDDELEELLETATELLDTATLDTTELAELLIALLREATLLELAAWLLTATDDELPLSKYSTRKSSIVTAAVLSVRNAMNEVEVPIVGVIVTVWPAVSVLATTLYTRELAPCFALPELVVLLSIKTCKAPVPDAVTTLKLMR